MRTAGWILSGAAVLVVTVVLAVLLLPRAITGAWERSSRDDLVVEVRAIHGAVLQERREHRTATAYRETSTLGQYLESGNHRVLSARSDRKTITLELEVWTEEEAEFDARPTLVTCLRVTSTPNTVRTSAIPCSADSGRHGKIVTTPPLSDVVSVSVPRTTPPCYSGSGRCN